MEVQGLYKGIEHTPRPATNLAPRRATTRERPSSGAGAGVVNAYSDEVRFDDSTIRPAVGSRKRVCSLPRR